MSLEDNFVHMLLKRTLLLVVVIIPRAILSVFQAFFATTHLKNLQACFLQSSLFTPCGQDAHQ
jgi:hypothetical protein